MGSAIPIVDMEHYANIPLGPRYALRLRDLRQWHILQITCSRCRNVGTVALPPLLQRWPEHTRLVDLAAHFRCTQCGHRGEETWQVCALPR